MGPRALGSWSAYHSCSVKEKALCVITHGVACQASCPKAVLRVIYVNRKKMVCSFLISLNGMVGTEQRRRRDGIHPLFHSLTCSLNIVLCIDYYTLRNGNMEVSTRNTVPALSLQPSGRNKA